MPRQYHYAGRSTREMAERKLKTASFYTLIAFGVGLVLLFFLMNWQLLGMGGTGFLVLLVLVRLIPSLIDSHGDKYFLEEAQAIRGAEAEEEIGELLDELDERFRVLHDISSPHGNIDHIVLSRHHGLFLIETKSHHGRVEIDDGVLLVNGEPPEKNFISQTLRNTYWLRDQVTEVIHRKLWVTPILVFTIAFVLFNSRIKGITILNKKFLLTTLQKRGTVDQASQALWDQWDAFEDLIG